MSCTIRVARLVDAPAFARIGSATFALACPPLTPTQDLDTYIRAELTVERFEEHIRCPSKSLFAAEVNGAVIGYLMLCREEYPPELAALQPLELRRLYVLPEFHGSGVAAALMALTLEQAAINHCDTIWLGVSKHNRRGIAFYGKHGFSVVGEQRFAVGDDIHEDYIMSRRPAHLD